MIFERGVVCIVVAGYIFHRYSFRGVIAVFHIVVVGYIVHNYCLRFERGVVHIVVAGDIVDHYCFMFDKRNGSYCCGCYVVNH